MSTCIFPGRFQPFHNGHLLVIEGMMKSCGRAVVVICCEKDGGVRADDLFSAEQVKEMISEALIDADIVDAELSIISDCDTDEEWVDKLLEAAGRPENPIIWSGDADMMALVEKQGIKTKKISPVPGMSGAELRKAIKSNDYSWKEKVPEEIARMIDNKFRK